VIQKAGADPAGVSKPADGVLDSVELIAQILDALAASSVPLGVTDLAQLLSQGKSRIHRHLFSLKHHGFVTQNEFSDKYSLGWKLFQLGEKASLESNIRQIAAPQLRHLSQKTGLGALLAVSVNGEPLVVDSVANEGFVSISVKPGNKPMPLKSAQGKVAMAYATPSQVEGIADKHGATTIAQKKDIHAMCAVVRQQVWASAPNETLWGINVLSVPVLRGADELVGIISLIGSMQHLPDPPPAEILQRLQGVAATLSRRMGNHRYDELGVQPLVLEFD
jgi:DNA-binding IclR family transcriptional regulator